MEYIDIIILLSLLVLGFWFGRRAEKKHYASIAERHKTFANIAVFNGKQVPQALLDNQEGQLVCGSVVIGQDYFKLIAASLRGFFGGRLSNYESIVDRARKEAILRMKAEARRLGSEIIFNVKIETSSISKGGRQNKANSIEVLAYGTAFIDS